MKLVIKQSDTLKLVRKKMPRAKVVFIDKKTRAKRKRQKLDSSIFGDWAL